MALGMAEMQMQFTMSEVPPLLSTVFGQGNNHFVDKICELGQCVLWEQVQ
jgi:hypothetical protein